MADRVKRGWGLRWSCRWAELWIDDPAETDCYGFMVRVGEVRLSVTLPAKGRYLEGREVNWESAVLTVEQVGIPMTVIHEDDKSPCDDPQHGITWNAGYDGPVCTRHQRPVRQET